MAPRQDTAALTCLAVAITLALAVWLLRPWERLWQHVSLDGVLWTVVALAVLSAVLGARSWQSTRGKCAVICGALLAIGLLAVALAGGGDASDVDFPRQRHSARPSSGR